MVYHLYRTVYNVVYVSKVSDKVAIVEHVDFLSLADGRSKKHGCHVGTPPRTIYGEITQSCSFQPIEFTVGVCHQFITFFCGSIDAYGLNYFVILAERCPVVQPVYAARTGINQMLNII